MDELRQALVAKERPPEMRYLEHLFNMLVPKNTTKTGGLTGCKQGKGKRGFKIHQCSRVLFSPKNVSFNKLDSCNVVQMLCRSAFGISIIQIKDVSER